MKRKTAIAALLLAILFAAVFGVATWGAGKAKRMIEERRHDIAGLALEAGGYEIGWGLGKLTLSDIRIYPAGREDEEDMLASADKLLVRVAPLAILRGTLHAREIRLVRPSINYTVTGKKSSNWDALHLGNGKDAGEERGRDEDDSALELVVDEVRIEGGELSYRNRVKGHRLDLTRVGIKIDGIRRARRAGELPTSFALKANAANSGGKISIEGKADPLGEKINFEFSGSMGSTPIGTFSSFYAGQLPFPVTAGSIAVSSRGKAKNDILSSSHRATISGLRVGGRDGPLINRYVLSQAGPIAIDASVGGNLASGELSVSAALSKGLAKELVKLAAAGVAGKAAGMAIERIKTHAPSPVKAIPSSPVKRGIENLMKRR